MSFLKVLIVFAIGNRKSAIGNANGLAGGRLSVGDFAKDFTVGQPVAKTVYGTQHTPAARGGQRCGWRPTTFSKAVKTPRNTSKFGQAKGQLSFSSSGNRQKLSGV